MEDALAALGLLCLVALSGLFVRLRRAPLPFVQISISAAAACPPFGFAVGRDPGLFMLVFVLPLLFSDAWRSSKWEFAAHRGPILMVALGLVLLTAIGVGYTVHWLMPTIPLAAAFVLAAALAPTDAVAVSAMAGRILPSPLTHILKGDTLINDVSGLTAVKRAFAAAMRVGFSPAQAARDLLWTALGGVVLGIVASILFRRTHAIITAHCHASPETANLVMLILLDATYLAAEHAGCSGVLAVATGGLAAGRVATIRGARLNDRLLDTGLWSMLTSTLGGMAYVLVGLQLPHLVGEPLVGMEGRYLNQLLFATAGILLALYATRYAWSRAMLGFPRSGASRVVPAAFPGGRAAAVAALAGVRGPITLVAVLALPMSAPGGVPFPAWDVVILLAAAVVLASLLVAPIGLPVMSRHMQADTRAREERELHEAEAALATAAIRAACTTYHARWLSKRGWPVRGSPGSE